MVRKANAAWSGSGKEGKGTLSTASKILNETPYNYVMRFADAPGTNPEELIGAAHAGCFSMKLSFVLGNSGFTADEIKTEASVTLENGAVTQIHLEVSAKIPGITKEQFETAALDAKANCPISKALASVPISMNAVLA